MKIHELFENSPTISVARHHLGISPTADLQYNTQAHEYSSHTRRYYKDNFSQFYKDGTVPVFELPSKDDREAPKLSNKPEDGAVQTPGYRGEQKLKALAGLPHSSVKKPRTEVNRPMRTTSYVAGDF